MWTVPKSPPPPLLYLANVFDPHHPCWKLFDWPGDCTLLTCCMRKKNGQKMGKKTKLLEITWNGKKIDRKFCLNFWPKFCWTCVKIWSKIGKTKLLEIVWNGEKIDRKCFLKLLNMWTIFCCPEENWGMKRTGKNLGKKFQTFWEMDPKKIVFQSKWFFFIALE